MENLFLISTLGDKVQNTTLTTPETAKMLFNTSNYKQPASHKISTTQRSNIAKEDSSTYAFMKDSSRTRVLLMGQVFLGKTSAK